MLTEEFSKILKKRRKKTFIYEWEYFSERIRDELLFSAMENFQFLYIEIGLATAQSEIPEKKARIKFWDSFLKNLNQKRYYDICGLLKDRQGIAIIFSNSNAADKSYSWQRFSEIIKKETGADMLKWNSIVRAEYPPKEFFAGA